jgi:DNA-binding GntR family transcriptional regulator
MIKGVAVTGLGSRTSRRVFREDVKEYLLDAILQGHLRPGDRIVETRIAQELGVSQGPVREALRDLEMFGFVVSEPFRGTRVRKTTSAELIEIYPIRAALEGVGAREAARHRDQVLLDTLNDLLEAMRAAAVADDRKAHVNADIEFHRTILQASGNRLLYQMWEAARLSSSSYVSISLVRRSLMELADRHIPIIDALRAGDPIAAESEMRKHIEELATWITSEEPTNDTAGNDGEPLPMPLDWNQRDP